jgi:hypothetical protein
MRIIVYCGDGHQVQMDAQWGDDNVSISEVEKRRCTRSYAKRYFNDHWRAKISTRSTLAT